MAMRKRFLSLILMFVLALGSLTVYAAPSARITAYSNLVYLLTRGQYTYQTDSVLYDFTQNTYEVSHSNYVTYRDIWSDDAVNASMGLSENTRLFNSKFENLTDESRQDFIYDVLTLACAIAQDTENGLNVDENAPTQDTVSELMEVMGEQPDMGSAVLVAIMNEVKPNLGKGMSLYNRLSFLPKLFSLVLGLLSILVVAFLGVNIALDLAYITIPAFQLAFSGSGGEGVVVPFTKGEFKVFVHGIISQEAKKAVLGANAGNNGEYRSPVGLYMKFRWKSFVLLGICLTFLVRGKLYFLVAGLIDLFTGLLGK